MSGPAQALQPFDAPLGEDRALPHCDMLALPKMMAPAARSRVITEASLLVLAPTRHQEPSVLFMPSALIESLTRMGMPCNLLQYV